MSLKTAFKTLSLATSVAMASPAIAQAPVREQEARLARKVLKQACMEGDTFCLNKVQEAKNKFVVYKNPTEGRDQRVTETQLDAASEVAINGSLLHTGDAENAVIPTKAFGNDQYIKDSNNDGKVDKSEVISWMKQTDKADGAEDGTINKSSAVADSLDLLGFKSDRNIEIQDQGHVRSTEKGLKKLNEHADQFYFIFAKPFVVRNMGKAQFIDYIIENESTRKLFTKTREKNNGLIEALFEKAYTDPEERATKLALLSTKPDLISKK